MESTIARRPGKALAAALSAFGFALASGATAATLSPGDILVADSDALGGTGAIIRVDPVSGAQTVVSSGQFFAKPRGIAIDANGNIFVADQHAGAAPGTGSVIRVDPATGTQTVVSTGQFFVNPWGIAVESTGKLVVADADASGGKGAIIRVDPATGVQTVVSSGGNFEEPRGIAVATDGTLFVGDSHAFGVSPFNIVGGGAVFRVDPVTGTQTVVSQGGGFFDPEGVAFDASGRLLVADLTYFGAGLDNCGGGGGAIFAIAADGSQTVISAGAGFRDPSMLAVESDGKLLVTDNGAFMVPTCSNPVPTLFRVDPATGSQTVLSSGGNFAVPRGVAIVKTAAGPAPASQRWVYIGSMEWLVRNVLAFANVPATGQSTAFVATMGDGVFKIVDNGSTLTSTAASNGLPTRRIRHIRGADPASLFVAIDGHGVYKSTDAGQSWYATNGSGPTALGCRSVRNINVRSATEVWAVTACRSSSGVYRSTDGGANWTRLGAGTIPDDVQVNSIGISGNAGSPTAVAVIGTDRDGFFRSADNGATWTQINSGLPAPRGANRISAFNASFLANSSQMLGYVEGDGVYRTVDGGASWTPSGTGLPSPMYSLSGIYRESATVHYIGTDNGPVYRTTDGGLNWSAWGNTGGEAEGRFFRSVTPVGIPGHYYLGGLAGLWLTRDNAMTFRSDFAQNGHVSNFALAADGRTAYFSSWTLGKIDDLYSFDLWKATTVGGLPGNTLGGGVYVDKAQPLTLFANALNHGLFKTTNGGATWSSVGLPGVEAGSFPHFWVSPADSQVIFASPRNPFRTATGGGIYRTGDGGATWTQRSGGLATADARHVTNIASAKDAPATLLAATADGVYRTTNEGVNWTAVLQMNDGGIPLPFWSVRFDPANPLVAYATAADRNADGTVRAASGVWRSADAGATWNQVLSGKLVNSVRPEAGGRVFVSLEGDLSQPAILASVDGGATWSAFNDGIATNDTTSFNRALHAPDVPVVFASMSDGLYVLDRRTVFNVPIDGAQEVPSNPVAASGSGTVTVNPVPNTITYSFNLTGLTGPLTGAHFHGPGARGVGAGIKIDITGSPYSGTVNYNEADEADILAGRWYVNFHTAANSGGEIRGQIDNPVPHVALTVSPRGPGTGTVTASPAFIDCGTRCTAAVTPPGTTVTLSATPAAGSVFSGFRGGGCTGGQTCTLTVNAPTLVAATFALAANPPRLANISTRGRVETGNDVMIGGFIIGGSTPKKVLITARGPSLTAFGVTGAMANPTLQLFSGQTVIASNDDWQTNANAADITATGIAPTNALESALLVTLSPGAYTAIVSGVGGGTGVGIVEVFEQDRPDIPLINISTRGQVQTGDNVMIGGFIIYGDAPKTVLITARGPSLAPFGITNPLANPSLQLFSGQTVIASNDDFGTAPNLAAIQATGVAPTNPLESALLVTLNPGAYTAIVTGVGGGTGVGIVEVFAQ